jgi:Phage terminase large subunit
MNAIASLLNSICDIDIPSVYKFLLEPAPYKILYGGRNGGKDWNTVRVDLILGMLYDPKYTEEDIKGILEVFAKEYKIKTELVERSLRHPHRFMYCREVMESIKRSVYTTIKDQISDLGLSEKWKIKDASIECVNGSDMIFAGLYRDPHNIKSAEGVTMCRVIEAQNVSEDSWKYLIPTIRKEGSEILVSFNPQYEDDPTFQRWVINPPKEATVKKINSIDIEPYLTNAAKLNRKNDYALRRHEYKNVWEGEPLGKGRKIYPMFTESAHVKKFDRKWLKDRAMFFMSCDPAQHYYPACLWAAWFKDDLGSLIKYIYAEYPTFDDFSDYFSNVRKNIIYTGTLLDLSNNFLLKDGYNEYGFEIFERYIDTRFAKGTGAQNYFSGATLGLVGEFAKKENGGIFFVSPNEKTIDIQREAIIKDLEYRPDIEAGSYNHPHFYVDPSCVNLIESLKLHRLKEDSEAEDQKRKDFSDALKILYAGMSTVEWEGPETKPIPMNTENSCILGGEPSHGEQWMAA